MNRLFSLSLVSGVFFGLTDAAMAAPQSAGSRALVAATLTPTTGTPPALSGAVVAPLPGGGSLLVGGATANGPQPFTYVLQGTAWGLQFPLFAPTSRTDSALVWDRARQNNLLFGGRNPLGAVVGDTWTWSNQQWQWVGGAAPSARAGHRMAYDDGNNLVLLFGGEDAAGVALGDQWAWNGSVWSLQPLAVLPPARAHHGMDYDRYRRRMVLYGGESGGVLRDDLWEWDGVAWAQVVTPPAGGHTPGARSRFALAYDVGSERVVLHGGEVAAGCAGDMWSWDGRGWTLHVSNGVMPSARRDHSLWFDQAARALRMFGGECGGVRSEELWTVELPVMTRWNAYGQGCVGSQGVPRLEVRAGSEAVLGQTLVCDLRQVPTTFFNPAFGVYDLQRAVVGGLPVPLDLAFVGLPGCAAWTGDAFTEPLPPMQAGVGTSLSIALPNSNLLLGVNLFLQALVFDNSRGRWASVSNAVETRVGSAIPAPVTSFTATPVAGMVPLTVQFTDTSTNAPESWAWDFDNDGVVDSTVQNPSFTYTVAGSYSVRLVVTGGGQSDTYIAQDLVIAFSLNPALNMLPIPAGTFQMGSLSGNSNERPVHTVTITRPFWMAKYELTQAEYQALMGSNSSHFPGPQRPVERVTWFQAMAYCQTLTAQEQAMGRLPSGYVYRLPTEAEWEYCCRAGTTTDFHVGASLSCGQANFNNCVGQTSAVGSYAPNAWGLHDMHGNVFEWCLDSWDGSANYPVGPVSDPYVTSGPYRVFRGGGWGYFFYRCRSSNRDYGIPGDAYDVIGFRVVCAPAIP